VVTAACEAAVEVTLVAAAAAPGNVVLQRR